MQQNEWVDRALPRQVPASVAPALNCYLGLMDARLDGLLSAFYLVGSIALGAFDERQSDVDFVAILSRRATPADVAALRSIHKAIARSEPHCKMEGSYLQASDLGRGRSEIVACPCYADGRLQAAGHHDLSPVTWWTLKHRAVPLLGQQPHELDFAVEWGDVRRYMAANLDAYWARWPHVPRNLAWLLTAGGVQWAVLGVCRLWYAFVEGDIPSKLGAGQYVLAHAPEQWRRILSETIAIRQRGGPSLYGSRLARARDACGFLSAAIPVCKGLALQNCG